MHLAPVPGCVRKVTYTGVLRGCEVCGAWESALRTLNHLTRHQPVGVQLDPQLYHAVLRTLCGAQQWGEAKGLIKRLHKHGLLSDEARRAVAAGPRTEAAGDLAKYIHYMLHRDDKPSHRGGDSHRHKAQPKADPHPPPPTDAAAPASPPRRPRPRDAFTRDGEGRRPPVVLGWQEAEITPPPNTRPRPPKPPAPPAPAEAPPSPRRQRQRQREAQAPSPRDDEEGDFKGRRQQRKR